MLQIGRSMTPHTRLIHAQAALHAAEKLRDRAEPGYITRAQERLVAAKNAVLAAEIEVRRG